MTVNNQELAGKSQKSSTSSLQSGTQRGRSEQSCSLSVAASPGVVQWASGGQSGALYSLRKASWRESSREGSQPLNITMSDAGLRASCCFTSAIKISQVLGHRALPPGSTPAPFPSPSSSPTGMHLLNCKGPWETWTWGAKGSGSLSQASLLYLSPKPPFQEIQILDLGL